VPTARASIVARTKDSLSLYAVAVAIWGSTWLAIKFQLGVVPPAISVVWRFALAAAILFIYALAKRMSLRFNLNEHLRMAAQGILLFGASYVCVYLSEQYLSSGLTAVIYSLLVFWTMIGARALFQTPITTVGVIAALLGVGGVALVFWPEVSSLSSARDDVYGLLIAIFGSVLSAGGNLIAVQNHRRGMRLIPVTVYSMMYGSASVAIYAILSRQLFIVDWSAPYLASLLYLAVFGSVVAFVAYLTLQNRIGADRASYVAVIIPIVALGLSTVFEDLHWHMNMVIGVIACLSGNLLAHKPTFKAVAPK
jgi:drug/metabolite transporter (DMT)-like permease